jgi:aryl-alcohol dehydrogenase-like predicted oxidoreductase
MNQRKLGSQGLTVSAIGLGTMSMTGFLGMKADTYGPADETESLATLEAAVEAGVTFFDTAETYGPFKNEELLGRGLQAHRHKLVIATKFGTNHDYETGQIAGDGKRRWNSSPERVKTVIDHMLRRLRTDYVDLLYQHRLDPNVPIEDTVGAMAELVQVGKVRYLGLSEVGPENIRRAHAVHPISALQSEYSIWERGVETEVFPVLQELGIGFVPYSPLGRGFLTGKYTSAADFAEGEYRHLDPRMQADTMAQNMNIVEAVRQIAANHTDQQATPGQVALAWVLQKGDWLVPIPGTKRRSHLLDNVGADKLTLSAAEMELLDGLGAQVQGARYSETMMGSISTK